MPRYRVDCYLFFGGIFDRPPDEFSGSLDAFDVFPSPFTPEEAFSGFEVLEETTDPLGCDLAPARGEVALPEDRTPRPIDAESEDEWYGLSVLGNGSCHMVVEAPSEDEVTDEVVKGALPARFYATDVEDLEVSIADD